MRALNKMTLWIYLETCYHAPSTTAARPQRRLPQGRT